MKTKLIIPLVSIGVFIGLLIGLLTPRPVEIKIIRVPQYYLDETMTSHYKSEVERFAGLMDYYQNEAESTRREVLNLQDELTEAKFRVSLYKALTGIELEVRTEALKD